MGLDFTWKEQDKKRLGNCGLHLNTIVAFRVPHSSGAKNGSISDSPERDSHYILYDKRLWSLLENIDIPEGKTGYALEYTQMERHITREEAAEKLRKHYEKFLPKDMKSRKEYIEFSVQEFIRRGGLSDLGTSFSGGMTKDRGEITVPQKKFIRWVSKEEYNSRLEQATLEELTRDDDEVYFLDAWYFILQDNERTKKCSTCPLCTSLGPKKNPIVEKLKAQLKTKSPEGRQRLLHGIYKQLITSKKGNSATGKFKNLLESDYQHSGEVVEFIAQKLATIPQFQNHAMRLRIEYNQFGPERPSCRKGSCYSHWHSFFDFISLYGQFEILRNGFFESEKGTCGEIPVKLLDKLENELRKSKEILQTAEVPAINIYDKKGNLIGISTYDTGWLSGNEHDGYGVGLEGKEEGITVVHQVPGLFDIPVSERREILAKEGLDGIMRLCAGMDEAQPRFFFREIVKQDKTFYGTTMSGARIELPPETGSHGEILTPFSGFHDGERIWRIEYTKAPAMKSFGYLQRLLERHLRIAQEHQIPIEAE